jgi:hypothetical protein
MQTIKIPCPTCRMTGKVKKTYPLGVSYRQHGFFTYHERIFDNETGKLIGPIVRDFEGNGTSTQWPLVKCLSCDGIGWIENQADLSVEISQS